MQVWDLCVLCSNGTLNHCLVCTKKIKEIDAQLLCTLFQGSSLPLVELCEQVTSSDEDSRLCRFEINRSFVESGSTVCVTSLGIGNPWRINRISVLWLVTL